VERDLIAVGGFVVLFVLMLLRVPVGVAMGLVGVGGFGAIVGIEPALKQLALSSVRTVTDHTLALIPMFILMGAFATAGGMSRELFRAANAWLGHRPGGLAMATIASCGGFAAICGSSVATAATMTRVALPEMRRFGYGDGIATGVIAAGGTLGILIPPSVVLAVYGFITEQDIGKLFVAGVIPGILAITLHLVTIQLLGVWRPGVVPKGEALPWRERWQAVRGVWAVMLLFLAVVGGIYGGVVTPTEAAALGAVGTFVIGLARRALSGATIMACLVEALSTSVAIFMVLIGALVFGYFLAVTQVPQHVTAFLVELPVGPYGILALIMVFYLLLGCILDAMAMIILTVPIVFPVVAELGFDPIWFGVIIVMTVELGLITPPVGMNVFVINSVAHDVSLVRIFRGVLPFVAADIVRLILLIAFPILVTILPAQMP